jgi:hypothetical protein
LHKPQKFFRFVWSKAAAFAQGAKSTRFHYVFFSTI